MMKKSNKNSNLNNNPHFYLYILYNFYLNYAQSFIVLCLNDFFAQD